MVSIPKVVAVLACGLLVGLGLSLNSIHTIKGEVLRVEGENNYFVREQDGKVVRMHVDKPTGMKTTTLLAPDS